MPVAAAIYVDRGSHVGVATPSRARPVYQRALAALTGRPFDELGFRSRNAIAVPSTGEFAPGRLSLHVDAEGRVWATIGRRTFLVGTSAALLMQAGLAETGAAIPAPPLADAVDPFGFGAFASERWPDVLPAGDPRDPGYRRLRYCRYADDHLLGFAGPKAEAEQIRQRLAQFLRDDL